MSNEMITSSQDDRFPCHCGCLVPPVPSDDIDDDMWGCDECGAEWTPFEVAIWETVCGQEEWDEFLADHPEL